MITVILFGCAKAPVGDYLRLIEADFKFEEREAIARKNYEIGKVYRLYTGDPILKIGNGYKRITKDVVFFPSATYRVPTLSQPNQTTKLSPLQAWSAAFKSPEDEGFVLVNREISGTLGIHVQPHTEGEWKVGKGWVNIKNRAVPTQRPWQEGMFFKTRTERIEEIEEGSFFAKLTFVGISDHKIRLAYTESTDDLARPVSYQEGASIITTDLYVPKEIIFKDISLQILEATNSYLSYRVVDDDDLNWIPK